MKDSEKHGRSAEEDPDYVDLEWATTLLRRVAHRVFPDLGRTSALTGSGDGTPAPVPGFAEKTSDSGATAAKVATRPTEDPATDDDARIGPGQAGSGPESGPVLGPPVPAAAGNGLRTVLKTHSLPLTIAAFVGVIAMINHFSGHDWGDDFALYMRQAKALTIGNIGEVISDNRFTVDNSGWNTFSPYSYPWGWPLLIAPLYAVFGLDYDVFKVVEVIALCTFLLAFFAITAPRVGRRGATILALLVGLSPLYIGGTDTVLSDIPYLCFVGVTLWWMDRCRLEGMLNASRRRLVILGLLLAYTYNVRREGVILLITLAALQAVVVAGAAVRARSSPVLGQAQWKALWLPYGTFAGAAVAFQLVLPTVLLPNAPGAGLKNVSTRITFYQDILAQQLGLQDPGSPMRLFNSEGAAKAALLLLVGLAAIGVVVRLLSALEEDIALAAYLGGASLLVLVSPYQEGRYLYTITPLLAYFAYQALPTMVRLSGPAGMGRTRMASAMAALGLLGLLALNVKDVARATKYHLDYSYVVHGPESPDAQEMFKTVREVTRTDDVILFFRSRAMMLYTDRRAVMGANLDVLLPRSDWYVMAKDSTYSQALLTDAEAASYGLTKRWENTGWVMWRVPPRPN